MATKQKNSGFGFKSLITGSIIGGLLGVLFAPKKGSELRSDIKEKTEDTVGTVRRNAEDIKENITEKVEDAKSKMSDVRSEDL